MSRTNTRRLITAEIICLVICLVAASVRVESSGATKEAPQAYETQLEDK